MAADKSKTEVIIKNSKNKKMKVKLKDGKWGESVYQLVNIATFTFDETDDARFIDIERGDEVLVKSRDAKGNKRDFYYWVESVTTHFEKDKETGKDKENEIILKCSSFPSILTRHTIEGNFKFTKGYGEIISKFAKKYKIKTDRIKLVKKKGFVNFKRMTLLEAFRRVAYIEGWCFHFRDKSIIFEPCKPPEDSGVTITDKEMISGSFTK